MEQGKGCQCARWWRNSLNPGSASSDSECNVSSTGCGMLACRSIRGHERAQRCLAWCAFPGLFARNILTRGLPPSERSGPCIKGGRPVVRFLKFTRQRHCFHLNHRKRQPNISEAGEHDAGLAGGAGGGRSIGREDTVWCIVAMEECVTGGRRGQLREGGVRMDG